MAQDIEEQKRKYIESILGFDGTELLYDGGYKLTLVIQLLEVSKDCPHGYSYAFNLFAPNAHGQPVIRILGTDNAHAPEDAKHPFDHWHEPKWNPAGTMPIGVEKGKLVRVDSLELHIGKFIEAAEKLLNALKSGGGSSSSSRVQVKEMAHEKRKAKRQGHGQNR
ncbi:MAG: hypothetical protein IT507_15940 [Burkholderiaceae bacterium]|nr:hypothetical protein [Burkholderiaceae bacterium]